MEAIVGTRPGPYRPRVPVLFYPGEDSRVTFAPVECLARQCLRCERSFQDWDAEGARVHGTMCCSRACYMRFRGLREETPPRVGPLFVRKVPEPEPAASRVPEEPLTSGQDDDVLTRREPALIVQDMNSSV